MDELKTAIITTNESVANAESKLCQMLLCAPMQDGAGYENLKGFEFGKSVLDNNDLGMTASLNMLRLLASNKNLSTEEAANISLLAAKAAGLRVTEGGSVCINGPGDAAAYYEAYNNKSLLAATAAGVRFVNGTPQFKSEFDVKEYNKVMAKLKKLEIQQQNLKLIFTAIDGAVVSGLSGEKNSAASTGIAVDYSISSYESKNIKFSLASSQYAILNNECAYTDNDGLIRLQKTPGINLENDYYCVAMAPGFTTKAKEVCSNPSIGINAGYTMQVQMTGTDDNIYNIDVLVADEKRSSDPTDFFPHNNVIEFIVDGTPKSSITNAGGNVDLDKVTGGSEVAVSSVYAYENGALFEGSWIDGWSRKEDK